MAQQINREGRPAHRDTKLSQIDLGNQFVSGALSTSLPFRRKIRREDSRIEKQG